MRHCRYTGASVVQQPNPRSCSVIESPVPMYDVAMDARKLTPSQTAHLRERVARQLRFAGKPCGRMETLGFPPSDPLFAAALRARHIIDPHGFHLADSWPKLRAWHSTPKL